MRELSLNVMDIVQNSVRAGASLITVQVAESKKHDTLTITITDNGCGMSAEQVKSVIDPFFTTRTTRKVGLGVPLFKMEAEMTGGSFQIDSEKGKGTKVTYELEIDPKIPMMGFMKKKAAATIVDNALHGLKKHVES